MRIYLGIVKWGFWTANSFCEFNSAVSMPRVGLFALCDRTLVFYYCSIDILEGCSWKEALTHEDKCSYKAQIQMFYFVFHPVHLFWGCMQVFQSWHLGRVVLFWRLGFGIKFYFRALCWAYSSTESHVGGISNLTLFCYIFCIWFCCIWMI